MVRNRYWDICHSRSRCHRKLHQLLRSVGDRSYCIKIAFSTRTRTSPDQTPHRLRRAAGCAFLLPTSYLPTAPHVSGAPRLLFPQIVSGDSWMVMVMVMVMVPSDQLRERYQTHMVFSSTHRCPSIHFTSNDTCCGHHLITSSPHHHGGNQISQDREGLFSLCIHAACRYSPEDF
jgi:hypothetical protein